MLAVLQDDLPVDEHVLHADGVLMRLLERRAIRDRRRIEDRDVGEIAFLQQAAAIEAEVLGGQARQPAHRVRERDHLFLAHVLAEQPREVAVGARMRVRLARNTPSGAIDPPSDPSDTHGFVSCFAMFSSDIRK